MTAGILLWAFLGFVTPGAHAESGVRILHPANGAVVKPGPGVTGFFPCEVQIEAFGTPMGRLGVEVDGIKMSTRQFYEKDQILRAQLPWWPWRGNDRYVIRVFADEMPVIGSRRFTNEIVVNVQGIPPDVVNPQNRIIAYYRDTLGQNIVAPPIIRNEDTGGLNSSWESAAYIGDTLFMVRLDDRDRITGGGVPISRPLRDGESGIPVQRKRPGDHHLPT